jgi:hypothetical protein
MDFNSLQHSWICNGGLVSRTCIFTSMETSIKVLMSPLGAEYRKNCGAIPIKEFFISREHSNRLESYGLFCECNLLKSVLWNTASLSHCRNLHNEHVMVGLNKQMWWMRLEIQILWSIKQKRRYLDGSKCNLSFTCRDVIEFASNLQLFGF